MDKEKIKKLNNFRRVCLKNAGDLLKAANLLLKQKIDHAAFHLSTLALEEIGKISLMSMRFISEEYSEQREIGFDVEDHEKKLFWAIWGFSFGSQKITRKQIQEQQGLAKSIHERRKQYLYTDPQNPTTWQAKMHKGESKMLYDFVYARYMYEENITGMQVNMSKEEKEELKWFLDATDDPEKRKQIFGSKSQEKLIQLGDVKKWIKWLKRIYNKHQEEMFKLTKAEIERKKPKTKKEALKPKWRIKIKIISPSHSIRNSALSKFNNYSDYIKLYKAGTNTLVIDIILSKAVPIQGLWEHGWGVARMFIAALNIATRGFFWWNIPIDTSRYYEEIRDLEKNAKVRIERNPKLSLNWKKLKWVLGSRELNITFLVFNYIIHLWAKKQTEAVDYYVRGISLLAKNDIHLRLELNAFEQFFQAVKIAMKTNGHWDGQSDLKIALHKQISWFYRNRTTDIDKMIDLALEVEVEHRASQEITLTEVIAMKTYCDVYFLKLAKDYEQKRSRKK